MDNAVRRRAGREVPQEVLNADPAIGRSRYIGAQQDVATSGFQILLFGGERAFLFDRKAAPRRFRSMSARLKGTPAGTLIVAAKAAATGKLSVIYFRAPLERDRVGESSRARLFAGMATRPTVSLIGSSYSDLAGKRVASTHAICCAHPRLTIGHVGQKEHARRAFGLML